jgi:hypothetical protein
VGYRSLTVDRIQCVGDGNTQCTFEGSWAA